jgi:hypothetical protein
VKKPVLVTIDEKVLEDFKSAFPLAKRSRRIQALLEKELEDHSLSEKDRELLNQTLQIAVRLDALEKALGINVQKDIAPAPAGDVR